MIEIIPAIDIIGGKCVRLSQGDYTRQKQYDVQPLDMVRSLEEIGIRRLHLVDLDGAKASEPRNLSVLEEIAANTTLSVEWGGGIKSQQALQAVFDAGASYAICGSIAVKKPELFADWLGTFGAERIILGADTRSGFVSVNGWQEDSPLSIDELIDAFLPSGLSQVICTDIERDGMLQGPSFELYQRLAEKYPMVTFTVSGGIGSIDDIRRLDAAGLPRVIVGKAIYEGRISLEELKDFLTVH